MTAFQYGVGEMPVPWVLVISIFIGSAPTPRRGPPTAPKAPTYAQALGATPVYLVRSFPRQLGNHGVLGRRARLYHGLAFTAYPKTAFVVQERVRVADTDILRVTTAEMPGPVYWLDARHVRLANTPFPERPRKLPSRAQVLRSLEQAAARGVPYCWGCNLAAGVPRLRADYSLTARQLARYPWDFAGVDCSGLLYEATEGATPRDTSALLGYGAPVPIQGKSLAELLKQLQPLDLIIWQGHMLIVLEHGQVVESINKYARRFVRKTVKSPLAVRLAEVMRTRKPVDQYNSSRHKGRRRFVVRRWVPAPGAAPGVSP